MTTTLSPDTTESASDEAAAPDLRITVGKIASYLTRDQYAEGGISTGDLAELRRIDPQEPFTPALWKILLKFVPNHERLSERQERQWAILLMAMGTCVGLHSPATPFGEALAKAGWSELRFVRLMEARGEHLVKQIRRLSQYLASKNQEADWSDAAWLLFVQEGKKATKIRQNIARDYYKRLYVEENKSD